jgi:hypothetical protein
VSAAGLSIIAENAVLLAAVIAGYRLLKQGGGLQVKAPPVTKKAPGAAPDAASKTVPIDSRRPA